jgi:c-di-GMP-binding flagellar brake protein YcgR
MSLTQEQKEEFEFLCQSKLELMAVKVVGNEDISFNSRLHFLGNNTLEITMPRVRGEIPPVKVKDKLDVGGTLSTGQKLLFYCRVMRVVISDELAKPSIITVSWPDNFAKKQMRQDVRIKCSLKVYYSDSLNDANYIDPENQYAGVLADISRGGGFLLTKEKTFFVNSLVHVYLFLKQDGKKAVETIIPGKVVVVKKLSMTKKEQVQGMAISFTNMSQQTEKALGRWIFEQQRIQLAERKKS